MIFLNNDGDEEINEEELENPDDEEGTLDDDLLDEVGEEVEEVGVDNVEGFGLIAEDEEEKEDEEDDEDEEDEASLEEDAEDVDFDTFDDVDEM